MRSPSDDLRNGSIDQPEDAVADFDTMSADRWQFVVHEEPRNVHVAPVR